MSVIKGHVQQEVLHAIKVASKRDAPQSPPNLNPYPKKKRKVKASKSKTGTRIAPAAQNAASSSAGASSADNVQQAIEIDNNDEMTQLPDAQPNCERRAGTLDLSKRTLVQDLQGNLCCIYFYY